MPQQSKQTPARQRAPQQIDMFVGKAQTSTGGIPTWYGLAPQTQAALTKLMTRLILDYADKNRIGSTTEGSHDL